MTHCWAIRHHWIAEVYGDLSDEYIDYMAEHWEDDWSEICILPDGHFGPHEWTRDDEIVLRFLA